MSERACSACTRPTFDLLLSFSVALWLCTGSAAFADNTGEHAPAQTAAVGAGFISAADALACGGGVASATANNRTQDYYGYGFSGLPATAQVTGIAVRVRANDGAARNRSLSVSLSWNGGASFSTALRTSSFKKNAPLENFTLGGSANLWGRASWSVSELSDANFRVRVAAPRASASDPANLDCLPVTVYYQVPGSPSLNVAKTAGPDPVVTGNNLTYTITYSNTGSAPATSVLVTDTTPANTTFVSASPAPLTAPAVGAAGTVTWAVGDLAVGASGSVTLVVNVDPALTVGTALNNIEYSIACDQNPSTPGVPVQTATIGSSALSLAASESPDPVTPGSLLTYTLTVSNPGTASADNVVVQEAYDGNVVFDHAIPAPDAGTDNTWTLATLAPGTQRTLTVVVRVASGLQDGTLLCNVAGADDSAGDRASAAVQTTVQNSLSLAIDESSTPNPVGPGALVVYHLNYTNSGTADLHNVRVRQARDAGVAYVDATPAPDPGTDDTWTVGDVAAGAGGTITVRANVSAALSDGTLLHDQSVVGDDAGHTASASTDTLVVASCGDGVVTSPEPCDEGAANGTAGSCCTALCQLRASGETCRASAGVCDPAETCDGASGSCGADAKSAAPCRPSAGSCDMQEACDGIGNECPADALVDAGTICRAAAGPCDATEQCTGVSALCPQDDFLDSSTVCRAGSGDTCDPAEHCNGSAASCPDDLVSPQGFVCNAGSGDVCDPDETCTGVAGAACPADFVAGPETVCRTAGSQCGLAEHCTGAASQPCPPDIDAAAGSACTDDGNPCTDNACDGSGNCVANDNAAACDDGLFCTVFDTCNGGTCTGTPRACDDGDACTSDACDESSRTCASTQLDCDDGSLCTADSCDPGIGCVNEGMPPADNCLLATKSKLAVWESIDDELDTVRWLWAHGDRFARDNLGEPKATTAYSLCLYDDGGSGPELVGSYTVPPSSSWKAIGPARATYNDVFGTNDGVRRLQFQPGASGKTKVFLQARGPNVRVPAPVSDDSMFAATPSVTVQMINDEGTCWASTFPRSSFKQNKGNQAKAQVKQP